MAEKILANAILESESVFLSGKLISDNVLVAFETLHYLKRKTQGKLGYMALKLDMSKAYDKVEWEFLEKTMQHLGLGDRLVSLIMSYFTSVSYSVLLNEQSVGNIKLERGLHQGDPLSPYLFLMCAIGLQRLLHTAEMEGHIQGVAICRNGPRVSHFFFADDSVLFCWEKRRNVGRFWIFWLLMREVRGKKLIETKLIFFSALILLLICNLIFKAFWRFQPFDNMRSTWVC